MKRTPPPLVPRAFGLVGAALLALALLLAAGSSAAASDKPPRFALSPVVLQDGKVEYRLPKGYTIDCNPGQAGTTIDPPKAGQDFLVLRAPPQLDPRALRGYNLKLGKAKGSPCEQIQVLLLPEDATRSQEILRRFAGVFDLVPPANAANAPDQRVERITDELSSTLRSTLEWSPRALRDLAESTSADGGAPRTAPEEWFFAPTNTVKTAKLPTLNGKQQYACGAKDDDKPSMQFTFESSRTPVVVKVTESADKCDNPRDVTLVLLPPDLLALDAAARQKVFDHARIEPLERDPKTVRLIVEDTLAAPEYALVQDNAAPELVPPGDEPPPTNQGCQGGECAYLITRNRAWNSDDLKVSLRFVTHAKRLLEQGKRVFEAATGAEMKNDERKVVSVVKRWALPLPLYTVPIQVHPEAATRFLELPESIARLLPDRQMMTCWFWDGNKENKVQGCAQFRRDGGLEYLMVLKDPALKSLQESARSLDIGVAAGGAEIVWREKPTETESEGKSAVLIRLITDDCRFTFRQLTRAVAGIQDGEVLYWVTSKTARCLCAPLEVRARDPQSVRLAYTEWINPDAACGDRTYTDGRMLRIAVDSLVQSAEKTHQLVGRLSRADNAANVRLDNGRDSFDFQVGPALDLQCGSDRRCVDVDIGRAEGDGALLEKQPYLAVDRVNRVQLSSPLPVAWRLRLSSEADHAPALPSPALDGAVLTFGATNGTLSSAEVNGKTYYFLQGKNATDTPVSVRAELEGVMKDLLLPLGGLSDGARAQIRKEALDWRVQVGHVDTSLPLKTKIYRLPWDLGAAARLRCPGTPPMRTGGVTRGMKRESYVGCRVEVTFPPADAHRFTGPQDMEVTVAREGVSQDPAFIARLRDEQGRVFDNQGRDAGRCSDRGAAGQVCTFALNDDLLRGSGKIEDYGVYVITVAHTAAGAKGLRQGLENAFVPDEYNLAFQGKLVARTTIVPRFACLVPIDDSERQQSWGVRYYGSLATGAGLFRTRSRGFGVQSSTDYNKIVQASFDYGVLVMAEPWNFSENAPVIPFLAPQLMVGLLGPTNFSQPSPWKELSAVMGLGFRLPAANKPGGPLPETQTGFVVWYELSGGARDKVIPSIVFGLNAKIGAAP